MVNAEKAGAKARHQRKAATSRRKSDHCGCPKVACVGRLETQELRRARDRQHAAEALATDLRARMTSAASDLEGAVRGHLDAEGRL